MKDYKPSEKTHIINLKILGQIESGIKLNTREKYFTLDTSIWSQGLRRLYRGDNRKATYEKISDLVQNIGEIIDERVNSSDKDEFKQYISPIIEQAIKGLTSLIDTYIEDKTFVSQIEVEITELKKYLERVTTSQMI